MPHHPAPDASHLFIFCPRCGALVLDAPRCAACQAWERPPAPVTAQGQVAWAGDLPDALASAITLADGVIYAGDAAGRVHALDPASGRPRWPQPADLGAWCVQQRVAAAGDLVIVGTGEKTALPHNDKAVLALAASDGHEVWRRPLDVRQISAPLVVEDAVFVATSDGQAVALTLATGAVRWRAALSGLFLAAPTLAGDLVIFGSDQGMVTAWHAATGALAWTFPIPPDPAWGVQAPYSPVYAAGLVYLTAWNNRCYALDAVSGQVRQVSEPTKRPPLTSPTLSDDALYFCAHDRYVYCLARDDLSRRWRTQLPAACHTAPVVQDGCVYVGSGDHHVYALDAADGRLHPQPLLQMARHIENDWASDGQRLFVGDAGGQLMALNLRELAPDEDPPALEVAQRWVEAATGYAWQGNLTAAARLFAGPLADPQGAAQLYAAAGASALAAQQYVRAGDLQEARRLYRELGNLAEVGALGEQLGELLPAAQAYEAAAQWADAARLYRSLAQWPQLALAAEQAAVAADTAGDQAAGRDWWEEAGRVFDQSQQPEKAVRCFERAGRLDLAQRTAAAVSDFALKRTLLHTVFGPLEYAQWLEQEGRLTDAAAAYVSVGNHADAARGYEAAAEFTLAAEQYQAAGQPQDAARLWERAGAWRQASAAYLQAQAPQRAADMLAQAGDAHAAALAYEALEAWALAAAQWEKEQDWPRAARAWQSAADWRQAAAAWQTGHDPCQAAEACWRAAQERRSDEDAIACYEQAMTLFRECGEEASALECDRQRRFLRRWPFLAVEIVEVGNFREGQSRALRLRLVNSGWGLARQIEISVEGKFDADQARSSDARTLQPDRQRTQPLYIIPQIAGEQLPLHLTVRYADPDDRPLPPLAMTIEVTVRPAGGRGDSGGQVNVYGNWIQSDTVEEMVMGDQVRVERHGAPAPAAADVLPSAPIAETLTCPVCGAVQSAAANKCSQCRAPFLRCAACGRSMPTRVPFCVYCGQRQ